MKKAGAWPLTRSKNLIWLYLGVDEGLFQKGEDIDRTEE